MMANGYCVESMGEDQTSLQMGTFIMGNIRKVGQMVKVLING